MNRRTKILLAVAGFLVLVPAALWIVGSLMPRDHVAHVEVRLAASRADVWARIADPVGSARWRASVSGVERLPDREGLPCFREHTSNGAITYVHETRVDGSRLVTRIVDNTDFGGRWEYAITADGAGTLLVITEYGEVYNPIFRVLGRYVFGYDTTLRTYASDLTDELEPGT